MSSFSVATLQEKLSRLSASQESIETLSLWIIHHKAFAKTSVTVWADSFTNGELVRATSGRKLSLFC
jgi:regulator of Ty1 transposition protein 103